jgi:DNA-binding NarL/FixJ family response regulator
MTYENSDGGPAADLSSREREVVELLARGCSTAEIGRQLFIAKSTVRSHIAAVVHKLSAQDRAAAVALLQASKEKEQ